MPDRQPLFSICIPNYNYGRFIQETIESVLEQSLQDFEIIVVDNASTDDSVDVIEAIGSDKVQLHRNRYNVGFAPNLQRATMRARGRFVNLLSSDDLMHPGALSTYAEVIESSGADPKTLVLTSDTDAFDNDGTVTQIARMAEHGVARRIAPPDERGEGEDLFTLYDGLDILRDRLRTIDTYGTFCSVAYSRDLWERVEGYTGVRTISPDKHFIYKVLALGPTVAHVRRPLFGYRDYESDNRAAMSVTIRQPIDDYLNVLEFGSEDFLSPLGLQREDLVQGFVTKVVDDGLVQMGLGNAALGRRLYAFLMATFPEETLRNGRSYELAGLAATGPLARVIAPPLRTAYIRRRDARTRERGAG